MSKYIKKTDCKQYSNPQTFQEFLELVARITSCNPIRSDKGYQVLCPSHKETHSSLHVTEGDDGKILLKCFAGCSYKDICASLGIPVKCLFPKQ